MKPSPDNRRCRRWCGGARRRGFSLVEIMIAIVILGLGLVMVASMFPVAWKRARQLSEHTVRNAVVESAHTTVASLARVGSSQFLEGPAPSFAGDLVFNPDVKGDYGTGSVLALADTRVHLLHLENVQLPAPGGGSSQWRLIGEEPYKLELAGATGSGIQYSPETPEEYLERTFFYPRVRFHQRLYPPLPARVNVSSSGTFTPGNPAQDPHWDELLAECGYCWAAFHRLRIEPGGPPFGPRMDPPFSVPTLTAEEVEVAAEAVDETRFYDMYYVTLRRPQASHRYAQQNVTTAPDLFDVDAPFVTPEALGPDFDCVLPVPWRVQVYFPFQAAVVASVAAYEETSIPTEIEVNTDNARTAPIVVEMFSKGAYFIDEITGKVFQVTRARVTRDTSDKTVAYVTLDREVFPEELDLPRDYRGWDPADHLPGQLKPADVNRTVWVFPPPVEPRRDASAPLVFSGPQPVVGVDIRTLTVSP